MKENLQINAIFITILPKGIMVTNIRWFSQLKIIYIRDWKIAMSSIILTLNEEKNFLCEWSLKLQWSMVYEENLLLNYLKWL